MTQKDSKNNDFANAILTVTGFPLSMLVRAWVLAMLWKWFATPFGVMNIGIVHAYGLLLLYVFVTKTDIPEDSKNSFAERIVFSFSFSAVGLGVGYIVFLCLNWGM